MGGFCLAFLVFMHFGLAHVSSVSGAYFDLDAWEIQRTDGWRYGYVERYHDTVLVKSREDVDSFDYVPPAADDELAALMLQKLDHRGLRAWAEFALYLALGLYLHRVRRFRLALLRSPWPRAVTAGMAAVGFVTFALAPNLATGYGDPFGGMDDGSDELDMAAAFMPLTTGLDPTISYTLLVYAMSAVPLISAEVLAGARGVRLSRPSGLWSLSATFWALSACTVSAARYALHRWWFRVCLPVNRREG